MASETAHVEQSILMDGGRKRVRVIHSFRAVMAGPCTPDYELVPTSLSLFSEERRGQMRARGVQQQDESKTQRHDGPLATGMKKGRRCEGEESRRRGPQAGWWLNGSWRCTKALRMSPDGGWREVPASELGDDEVVNVAAPAVVTVDLSPVQGLAAVAPVAVRRSVDMRLGGFGGSVFFLETNVWAPDHSRVSVRREISGDGEWLGTVFRSFERVADTESQVSPIDSHCTECRYR